MLTHRKWSIVLLAFWLVVAPVTAFADDFKNEVIYQIFTDRFFDGSTSNNNPAQSSGLYDATHTDLTKYQGGDFAGIQAKIPYLKGMGVTCIWISPPFDNCNVSTTSGIGYHGYWARDFKRIEEHFGNSTNSWTEFDAMVNACHANGIKVVVDFAPNHTTPNNSGEFGALYNNGTYMADINNDPLGYFHHNPNISNYDNRYETQYYALSFLSDLNQENATVSQYLLDSMTLLQQHGVDGFRVDAVKHLTWGWQYAMANKGYTNGNSFYFGEWYQSTTGDPLYKDSAKFANKSGISLLDFPLNQSIRNVFGSNASFTQLDATMGQENVDFKWANDQVTFVDNHDMSRFLTLNNNQTRLHQALAYILTSRGIPCIFYGTEQYLFNNTNGGTDPYNRPWMNNQFSTTTTAYQVIKKLSDLRQTNRALGYGTTQQRWINNDVYVYERKFFNSVVLVAINKGATATNVTGLLTSLPAGTYSDVLTNQLAGVSLTVNAGTGGNNPAVTTSIPANSVSVWSYVDNAAQPPRLGSVGPTVAQPGVKVTIGGRKFGTTAGSVKFGTTAATIQSWTDSKIVCTVPNVAAGNYTVTVTNSSAQVSNTSDFTVLGAAQIPVTFTVINASPTSPGDNIYLTGNVVELGNWGTTFSTAVGPMNTPNYPNWFINTSVPAGTTIQFKFIKIKADGTVVWENGANHTYTVPASGVGFVNVNWQY
jgi:glycosidase